MGWADRMNAMAAEGKSFLFILDFSLENTRIIPLDRVDQDNLLFSLPGYPSKSLKPKTANPAILKASPLSYADFLILFNSVKRAIQEGNTYLLNLCFKTPVFLNLSLKEIFQRTQAPYKLWVKDEFVVFSPETFIKIKDGKISTYPMKGTALKTGPESKKNLLENIKETAEHATITDLLRNDLSKIAMDVKVPRYRYIDEIHTPGKTLLQVSSMIEGEIMPSYRNKPGSILEKILPAGSVTGAPKKKTVDIIKTTEGFRRGWYTGVFGIWDKQSLDSAVMIRYIEQDNDKFWYKSGAGITFMSDAKQEYDEFIQKIYLPVY